MSYLERREQMRSITYCEAINEALCQEMERDESVFTYGIGVPDHKRIFGSTKNLVEKFGSNRCFDTPLSEEALTGVALGASLLGLRPILVHMRVDFMLLSMNQIVNLISSYHYGSGGMLKAPLVIRAIVGRGWGQAYQHSKTLHGWFGHIPGLKVVMPVTPYEAKGMLIAAIRDDNPVIFFEHRWLYDAQGEVPIDPYTLSLDKPTKLREGHDLTIIATSWMNIEALHAAEILARNGYSVGVINAGIVSEFDDQIIIDAVSKSGRCIVADNDWVHCGFGAELATRIYQKAFRSLQAPIERIGFQHAPCPCARPLETAFYPNAITIIRTAEKLFNIPPIDISKDVFYSYENKFRGPF